MTDLPMKSFRITQFFFVFLALVMLASAVQAAGNPRYAGLVVEADTGNVLYADRANDRRYPASLTKMMTLYMAFEAVRDGKLGMDTVLTTSKKAASMPQTNISLRTGDKISVREAIDALVVHSANDVAVVLAEQLGGSEWEFGSMMTRKARQLGMNATVFRNASGLPDSGQYTSARDMAVLGMALRKHFPQFYPLFKKNQFTYKGRTYHSHNRVNNRLPGAEGLKTGYINASGFNLVTTVTRNGKTLVGVVMGGRTAASRDSHMINLIERSYAQLDKGDTGQDYAAISVKRNAAARPEMAFREIPSPSEKPAALMMRMAQKDAASVDVPVETVATQPQPEISQETVEFVRSWRPQRSYAPQADYEHSQFPVEQAVARMDSQSFTQRGQFVPYSVSSGVKTQDWAIQVGAYNKAPEALMAAINAVKIANDELAGAQVMVSDAQSSNGAELHRARLAYMDEGQARRACQKLMSMNHPCFVVRLNQGESL